MFARTEVCLCPVYLNSEHVKLFINIEIIVDEKLISHLFVFIAQKKLKATSICPYLVGVGTKDIDTT